MRLGALMERVTHYRILGPVIEAACDKKWKVRCFHFRTPPQTPNQKSSLDAANHPVPWPIADRVQVSEFSDAATLKALISDVDAVISTHGPAFQGSVFPTLDTRPSSVPWFVLQTNIDTFEMGYEHLLSADRILLQSEYWADICRRYARLHDWPSAVIGEIEKRFVFIGYPQIDALSKLDKREARRRYGIPDDRPVVTFLPILCAHRPLTPWCKMIFAEENRLRRVWNAARHMRSFRYAGHALGRMNNYSAIQAVRKFCDNNDCFLLIKTRHKDKRFSYEEAAADLVVSDSQFFPPSFLDVVAVSDLVIGSHSTSVMEAIFAGVPYLLIDLPHPERHPHTQTLSVLEAGDPSLWRCDSAIWRLGLDALAAELPRRRLSDFPLSRESRQRYVERIIGEKKPGASQATLETIASTVHGSV